MNRSRQKILDPVGIQALPRRSAADDRKRPAGKPVVGLLNNSKPNVSYFLETVEESIQAKGYRTLKLTKPRSAGPCPDLEKLAGRCDYVINAVAD